MSLGHEAAIVGDHKQARDAFVDAAKLSPGDERIAYQLGRAYIAAGRKAEGEKQLDMSKELKDKARSKDQ